MRLVALVLAFALFANNTCFASSNSTASIHFALKFGCENFLAGAKGEKILTKRPYTTGEKWLNVVSLIFTFAWVEKQEIQAVRYTTNGNEFDAEVELDLRGDSSALEFGINANGAIAANFKQPSMLCTVAYDWDSKKVNLLDHRGNNVGSGTILDDDPEEAWKRYYAGTKSLVVDFPFPTRAVHGSPSKTVDSVLHTPVLPPFVSKPVPITHRDQNGKKIASAKLELAHNFIRVLDDITNIRVELDYDGKGPE